MCPQIQTNPHDKVMFSLSGPSSCHSDGVGWIVNLLPCFCLYVSLCIEMLINDDQILARGDLLARLNSENVPKAGDVGKWGAVAGWSLGSFSPSDQSFKDLWSY